MCQGSPESRQALCSLENQMKRVIGSSVCSSKHLPWSPPPPHSSWLTRPPLMFFTAARILCISPAMGGELPFLQSSLLQLTSLHCMSRPAYSFLLTLFSEVALFPNNMKFDTKNPPVISWFSWLPAWRTKQVILLIVSAPRAYARSRLHLCVSSLCSL